MIIPRFVCVTCKARTGHCKIRFDALKLFPPCVMVETTLYKSKKEKEKKCYKLKRTTQRQPVGGV